MTQGVLGECLGVRDDSESASFVDFIDKIAICHALKTLVCTCLLSYPFGAKNARYFNE